MTRPGELFPEAQLDPTADCCSDPDCDRECCPPCGHCDDCRLEAASIFHSEEL